MSWIQVTQTCKVVEDAERAYETTLSVDAAYGIERQLFVLRRDDDSFQYVATTADLAEYPASKAEAQESDVQFYRASTTSPRWTSQDQALKFLSQARDRLRLVVRTVGATAETVPFGGIEAFVYDSEDQ